MPTLDVTEALLCDEFTDYVSVLRRTESVNEFGEVTITPVTYRAIPVVITSTESNTLVRSESAQYQPRTHTIVSVFGFRGPSPAGGQPDLVEYMGTQFMIDVVEPYSRYGPGFVQARMTSVIRVDAAPPESGGESC